MRDAEFYTWCESVPDCGYIVQPMSATARQRKLGWDAAIAAMGEAPACKDKAAQVEAGLRTELWEVEQILGKALGYPWYKDDQKNFPGATEADGVCVGEHTVPTLAFEAARRLPTQVLMGWQPIDTAPGVARELAEGLEESYKQPMFRMRIGLDFDTAYLFWMGDVSGKCKATKWQKVELPPIDSMEDQKP